ncbi:uncharacterized protein LTHEOB_3033 [Neofusicoccum parvum]|uniref:Uncharacterized protein n=2 Tax=Neofusicoccum parvum TaxID=310453 RepID=R1GZ41_BOTPV|nr:hypothetical protein UCRNP2_1862 [Neofusicoccum parvum UCRNP2]GME23062.1 uncharacterized protein LTHEOB_3033 [Neofusicoccum parvum]GME50970.1 uncharacterized protein LTHEOB_3033 [Neofusicoccum parvum]
MATPTTKWYPIIGSNTTCGGPNSSSAGVCRDTCFSRYLVPLLLNPIHWNQSGTPMSAEVNWTLPHWGDWSGRHIPFTSQVAEHTKSYGGAAEAAEVGRALMSAGPPSSTATDKGKPAEETPKTTAKPHRFHTPVPRGGLGATATEMLTPRNPDADTVDPKGWSDEEKLWMYQNQLVKVKRTGGKKNPLVQAHNIVECYSLETCWDHCQRVKRRDFVFKMACLVVLGVFSLIAALGALTRMAWVKRKERKERKAEEKRAEEERGDERSSALDPVAEDVDGAADDVVGWRRWLTLNRREASMATGSETTQSSEEGVVRRA